MKSVILTVSLTLLTLVGYSQDQIITILGDTITCDIIEVNAYNHNMCNVIFNTGKIESVYEHSTNKLLNVDNVISCRWNDRLFSGHQLKIMAQNKRLNTLTKTNLNLPKIGLRRMKWGGAFLFIGGAAMTTGFILSTKSGSSPDLINALIIGGSVNMTLGGALILSGAYKNSKLK